MPADPSVTGQQGAGDVIPQPKPPARTWYRRLWPFSTEIDERNQIERDSSQSHNIRRVIAYGAMVMVLVMYCSGLFAIAFFLGITPHGHPVEPEKWHIVVTVLVALFTVPTVLAISVMRLSAGKAEDIPKTVHEWLGKVVEKAAEKFTGD
jgi:hypothetical protein